VFQVEDVTKLAHRSDQQKIEDCLSVQEHNAKHVPELYIDIAGAMGISGVEDDSQLAISKVLDRIRCASTLHEPPFSETS
jgi:hypothetical protein